VKQARIWLITTTVWFLKLFVPKITTYGYM
jgi:hypothetical protein